MAAGAGCKPHDSYYVGTYYVWLHYAHDALQSQYFYVFATYCPRLG